MRLGRLGVAALVVTLLGSLALAGVAAAEGSWRVKFENITSSKSLVTASASDVSISIPEGSNTFVVLCEEFAIDEGLLLVEGASSGVLLFGKCLLYVSGKPSSCQALQVKAPFKGHLFLHGGKSYELIGPSSGTKFFTLKFANECLEDVPISGCIVLADVTAFEESLEVELVEHLLKSASPALFPEDGLRAGTKKIGFEGTIRLKLGGSDIGRQWSGWG